MTALFAAAALSYLFGSIPAGLLVARTRHIDIRQHGSGNIGATNVGRVLGKKFGYIVFALDSLKGLGGVRLAFWIASRFSESNLNPEYFGVVAAIAAILGHTFPVWLRFRGGKGVATSVGAVLGLAPLAAAIILVVWYIIFQATRYVSVASMCAAAALPVAIGILAALHITGSGYLLVGFSTIIAFLVVWRHRSNIKRLIGGTEPKFSRK